MTDAATDLYTPLFSQLFLPAWERLRGRDTLAILRSLLASQWWSTDELRAHQETDLRALLHQAHQHVPAYRRRIDDAGVDPATMRLADLSRLPLLTREAVREEAASFVSTAGGPMLTKSTSGTTGTPFRFQYSARSEIYRQAVKLRGYGWAGAIPGKRTLHYWGPPAVAPAGWKARKVAMDRALRRELYLDCARQGPDDLERTVAVLRKFQPQVLVGFTQGTVELARYINERGRRDWPALRVVCGAERLFPHDRPVLEAAFSEPGGVFETYGCREFMLMASECPAHAGLHTSMENLIVEIVDGNGRPVGPGETGQVAVTDLHNPGMPLVRYLTGDLAQRLADGDQRCACGRGLARIAGLEGRQSDLLYGHDGRRVPGLIINALFAAQGGRVRQFQLLQRKDRSLLLKVAPQAPVPPGGVPMATIDADTQAMLEDVKRKVQSYFGALPLTVEVCADIPVLPSGKRRYVVVER